MMMLSNKDSFSRTNFFSGDNSELSPQRDWLLFNATTIKRMKQVQRTMLQIQE